MTSGEAGPLRGNLLAALAEGVFLMGCERNADTVQMVSYAPLLANLEGRTALTGAPPPWHAMIYFDGTRVFGTASYYLWKLFGTNRPDQMVDGQHGISRRQNRQRHRRADWRRHLGRDGGVQRHSRRTAGASAAGRSISRRRDGWQAGSAEGGDWSVEDGAVSPEPPRVRHELLRRPSGRTTRSRSRPAS